MVCTIQPLCYRRNVASLSISCRFFIAVFPKNCITWDQESRPSRLGLNVAGIPNVLTSSFTLLSKPENSILPMKSTIVQRTPGVYFRIITILISPSIVNRHILYILIMYITFSLLYTITNSFSKHLLYLGLVPCIGKQII